MDTENCCLGGQKCFNYYEQVDRQTSLFVRVVNSILAPGLRECETRQVSGSSHRVLQGKLTWKLQFQSYSSKKYATLTFSHQDHEIPYCRVERKTQAAVIHRMIYSILTNYNSESFEKKMLILPRKSQCKGVLWPPWDIVSPTRRRASIWRQSPTAFLI